MIELSDEMLAELSYVQISTYRTKAMKSLDDDVKMPTQIAEASGIRTKHISNVLRQLKEHKLVECINPEVKKSRLYRLTDKGEELIDSITH